MYAKLIMYLLIMYLCINYVFIYLLIINNAFIKSFKKCVNATSREVVGTNV